MHTGIIWTAHLPDRSEVWFVCTPHCNELRTRRPDVVVYPARFRKYCGVCPGSSA